jgi:predicted nucleic acid-binding protein
MRVVVDTNIVFSSLAAGCGDLAVHLVSPSEIEFYAPRFLFVELFKYSARIQSVSKLPQETILEALNQLVESLHFIEAANIPMGTWMEARTLCEGVDLKDTPFVALSLHLNALLWTNDEVLREGLKAKGFDRFYRR